MVKSWGKYLDNKIFVIEFFISTIILAAVLFFLTIFLEMVEARTGVPLNDPILGLFNPVDVTWFIFILIYGTLFIGIVHLISQPVKLIFALQLYTILVLTRITAMHLVALDPPLTMIPLNDPFAEFFITGSVMTKDLFFSGHTATLFFLFLIIEKKVLRYLFLCASIAIAVLVILQHVHYTIDVFTAPFFTYAAFKSILLIRSKINLNYS